MAFNSRKEFDGKVTVIECQGRLDTNVADDFRTMMKKLVDEGTFQLVVDLGKTEFIDSSGLGALVSRIAVTRSKQGDVRLASPSKTILKLLDVTHLDKIFKCFDDVESAVKSF